MKHSILKFTAVLLCLLFLSCTKHTSEPCFYYWRTKFNLSSIEKKALNDLKVTTLFVRFFDVDISKDSREPQPVGVIAQLNTGQKNSKIIPVVFITNRTFFDLKKEEVAELAKNVLQKINSIKDNYSELQFDCDWSERTKENYFLFLEEIKQLISKKINMSCTIRLHQVKYAFKTGIPPVDKGILMFYNMGNVSDLNEKNSIYDPVNAEKYTAFLKEYKLPLDAALPIFHWYVHYRNNTVIGLITKTDRPNLNNKACFLHDENITKFSVITDHLENGIFYKANDVLKEETLSDEELLNAAELLQHHLKPEDRRIIFYDLDENNIKYYDKETFKKIMAVFN